METRESSDQHWRFGIFEVDSRRSELRRGGTPVKLREQSFRILVLLLERAGEIVTREELRQGLWPSDTYVDFEHSLNTAIMKLRDALGDSADKPLYIETIPKRGYRFVAPVTGAAASTPVALRSQLPESARVAPKEISASERMSGVLTSVEPPPSDDSTRQPASTAVQPRSNRKNYRKPAIAATCWVLLGILVAAFVWRGRNRISPHGNDLASSTFPGMRSVGLLSLSGGIEDVALSPDAKEIAFIWDGGKQTGDLYLGLIAGERRDELPLRLTHIKGGSTCCTSWSQDGRELAYGVCNDQGGAVFAVPALGGPSRKLADVTCLFGEAGFPVWTRDGKSLLLVDRCAQTGPTGIVRLSLATGEKQCLDRPPAGDVGDWKLALSPDGETVAFIRWPTTGVSDLYTLRLSDGTLHRVTSEGKAILDLMWIPDGQHLVVSSSRIGLASIWRVSAAGGAVSKETVYPDVGSLSADGRRLVYVRNMNAPATVWRADLTAAGGRLLRLTNLVSSGNSCDSGQPSPDGQQIVYACQFGGGGAWGEEIWKSNADGSDPTQLTSFGGMAGTPRWSPDSKSIAFDYRPGSHSQIFTMDADGRNQRMLTSDAADNVVPSWSRDGKVLYFSSNRTGRYEIWKKELADGKEFQVTRHGGIGALEAYDEKTLYYSLFDGAGTWSVPVTGGDEKRLTEVPRLGHWGDFAVTDSGLYLMDIDHDPDPAIFFYDFLHRKLTPVLTLPDLHDSWDANLSCLRTGKVLLFGRATSASSITMVEYQQ